MKIQTLRSLPARITRANRKIRDLRGAVAVASVSLSEWKTLYQLEERVTRFHQVGELCLRWIRYRDRLLDLADQAFRDGPLRARSTIHLLHAIESAPPLTRQEEEAMAMADIHGGDLGDESYCDSNGQA